MSVTEVALPKEEIKDLSEQDVLHHKAMLERIKKTYDLEKVNSVKELHGYRIPCPECTRTQCWDTCIGRALCIAINKDYEWFQAELQVDEKQFTLRKNREAGITEFIKKYDEFLEPGVNLFKALKKDGTYAAVTKREDAIRGMMNDYVGAHPVVEILGERAVKLFTRFQWANIGSQEILVLMNAFQTSDPTKYTGEDELGLIFDALGIIESFLLLKAEKIAEKANPDAEDVEIDVEQVSQLLESHFDEDGNEEKNPTEEVTAPEPAK